MISNSKKNLIRRLNPLNNMSMNLHSSKIKLKKLPHKMNPVSNSNNSYIKYPIDMNNYNYLAERKNYISHFKNIDDKRINPLISRQDLSKYLINPKHFLRKNLKQSLSLVNINSRDNSLKNKFYNRRVLPIIDNKYKKRKLLSQKLYEPKIKHKNILNINQFRNQNELNNQNSKNLESDRTKNDEEINTNNKFASLSHCYIPRIPRGFHKTQIFNGCKPYLSDDYTILQ